MRINIIAKCDCNFCNNRDVEVFDISKGTGIRVGVTMCRDCLKELNEYDGFVERVETKYIRGDSDSI